MDEHLLGELRYATAAADVTPATRARVENILLDLADSVSDSERNPGLPWRVLALLATKIYDDLAAAEIARVRAGRGLAPLPQERSKRPGIIETETGTLTA
jgi:hypothetical protein